MAGRVPPRPDHTRDESVPGGPSSRDRPSRRSAGRQDARRRDLPRQRQRVVADASVTPHPRPSAGTGGGVSATIGEAMGDTYFIGPERLAAMRFEQAYKD